LEELLFTALTKGDKIERNIGSDILFELSKCFSRDVGLDEIRQNYEDHIRFHSQQGKFYYEENGVRTFSDENTFKQTAIVSKIAECFVETK